MKPLGIDLSEEDMATLAFMEEILDKDREYILSMVVKVGIQQVEQMVIETLVGEEL